MLGETNSKESWEASAHWVLKHKVEEPPLTSRTRFTQAVLRRRGINPTVRNVQTHWGRCVGLWERLVWEPVRERRRAESQRERAEFRELIQGVLF